LKAIVIREFGPPSVMKLEEVPTPEPGPGEVLIKVHAVSVNRTLDAVVRAGKYARRVTLPLTPGVDPSGVIAKVGPGVTERKVGDRVTVQLRFGNESGADQNLLTHSLGISFQAPQPVLREIEAFEHALDASLERFLFDVVNKA